MESRSQFNNETLNKSIVLYFLLERWFQAQGAMFFGRQRGGASFSRVLSAKERERERRAEFRPAPSLLSEI